MSSDQDGKSEKSGSAELIPNWIAQLEPEIAERLKGQFKSEELFEIEATIEWYEGELPAHIAIHGLEQAVPGSGGPIIAEGIERSKLERKLVNRHSLVGILQSSIAQISAAIFGLIALATCARILFSNDELSWTKMLLAIAMLIVGVGGPIAAAILARNFRVGNDSTE